MKVAVNSLDATASEQGVRQVWPVEVLASAPAGSDSNWTVVAEGAGDGRLKLGRLMLGMPEQPPRATDSPHNAKATTRFMILSVHTAATAARTRIPEHHLKALEDEAYKSLPPAVYTRGFVIELAKALRLDPESVARSYLRQIGRAHV